MSVDGVAGAREKIDDALRLLVVEHVQVQQNRLARAQVLDYLYRFFELARLDHEHFARSGG